MINMNIIKLILIGYSLSADAVSASIVASLEDSSLKTSLVCSITFGIFQAIMPLLGFLLSEYFNAYLNAVDHYIAFFLLTIIGINMIKESKNDDKRSNYSFKIILVLGFATSIDAFAIGCTLKMISIPILISATIIGLITFSLCLLVSFIGRKISSHYAGLSKIIGGIILIIMGFHTLIEHLL